MSAPTAAEFRAYLRLHGLSRSRAATLVGSKPRFIGKLTGGRVPVPASVWFMLQDKVNKGEHLNANSN